MIVDATASGRRHAQTLLNASFCARVRTHSCGTLACANAFLQPDVAPQTRIDLRMDLSRLRSDRRLIDLLLIKLELPDGNGSELLTRWPQPDTVKVVMSELDGEAHWLAAFRAGADGYLLTQEKMDTQVQALQMALQGIPPISGRIVQGLLDHVRRLSDSGPPPRPDGMLQAATDEEALTPREGEVLGLLAKGLTIKEIAVMLGIKWFTVNDHIKAIYRKLRVGSRAEAAVFACRHGWV
jgi:DNA-binding NarL/FixJ family response regulator